MAKRFTRLDGESMPQFQARIAALQAAERPAYTLPRVKPRRSYRERTTRTAEQRAADRIDGYDRDDLGPSHD